MTGSATTSERRVVPAGPRDRGRKDGGPGRAPRGMRQKFSLIERQEWPYAALFLAPAFVLFITFIAIPFVDAFRLSFASWDGYNDPAPVGTENFSTVLHDPIFQRALRNNLIFLLASPIWVLFPLLVALILQSRPRGWKMFRFVFMLPAVMSAVFTGIYFKTLLSYDGPVNEFLRSVGLDSVARGWLVDPNSVIVIRVGIILWATFGVGTLIFMAALNSVDVELQEAALLDGANVLSVHRYVTLPAIRPTVQFWAINIVILTFTSLFPLIYVITGGGPGYSTYVMEFYVYESAFTGGKYGVASAAGLFVFGLAFVFSLAVLAAFRRSDK